MIMNLFDLTAINTARTVTRIYSTSFYLSTALLEKEVKDAIFSIYGFVRFADEIVDTFHSHQQEMLLTKFETDLKDAIQNKISMNPVLHAYQLVVNRYNIPYELTDAFLSSMKADLYKKSYSDSKETDSYVYGSANVVGLMCLKVFTKNNQQAYEQLKEPAMKLGSAFQKVNFLRDLKTDIQELERTYFSNCDFTDFKESDKKLLISEIKSEFREARKGISKLPGRSALAVLTAYYYYLELLRKIERTPAKTIMEKRIRVANSKKMLLLAKGMFMYKLNLI